MLAEVIEAFSSEKMLEPFKFVNNILFTYSEEFGIWLYPNERIEKHPEFEDYAVTTRGQVLDIYLRKWLTLTPCTASPHHLQVKVQKCGKKYTRKVHRLVLETFVGPRPLGLVCCHFPDRAVTNNNLENIRWDTQSKNYEESVIHGTNVLGQNAVGSKNKMAMLIEEQVLEIRRLWATGDWTLKMLGWEFNVSWTTIRAIVNRETWTHI